VKATRKYEPWLWKQSVTVNVGKKRDDGAFYWRMVEYGHRIYGIDGKPTGRSVPPMGYAVAGLKNVQSQIVNNLGSRAREELHKRWKRLPKAKRPNIF